MKYVAVRVLDQYLNIKEYFLKLLPKEKILEVPLKKLTGINAYASI